MILFKSNLKKHAEIVSKVVIVNTETGEETLKDILNDLLYPGYNMRFKIKILEFDTSIKKYDDLKERMILKGIVTNITNFEAFLN